MIKTFIKKDLSLLVKILSAKLVTLSLLIVRYNTSFWTTIFHKPLLRASLLHTLLHVNRKMTRYHFCPWVSCSQSSWGLVHIHNCESRWVLWWSMYRRFFEICFSLCIFPPPSISSKRPGFVNLCFWDLGMAESRNSLSQWALQFIPIKGIIWKAREPRNILEEAAEERLF